jgi:hypothetical protein
MSERHSHDLTNGVVPEAGLLGHSLWDMALSFYSISIYARFWVYITM